MKLLNITILSCLFIFPIISLYANSNLNTEECAYILNYYQEEWMVKETKDRIYIKKESLFIRDDGIYIIVANTAFPLRSLQWDHNGYYTYRDGWFGTWQCDYCQYWNGSCFNTCQNCSRPKQ